MRTANPLRLAFVACSLACLARVPAYAQSERRLSDLLAAGDQAWSAGNHGDALRLYSEILSRDSTSERALFRVATLLSWKNDLDHSIALFRRYVALSPGDAGGRVALARVLAWRGDFRQALSMCDSLLATDHDNRDAALLAAQVTAWSGHLVDAAVRYDRWVAEHPLDGEGWSGLAQVWQWAGRSERARQALQHALAVDPTNATALAQSAQLDAELSPSAEPGITSTDDSDQNRTITYLMRGGIVAPWSARLQTEASFRTADFGVAHGTSATLRTASSWAPLEAGWTVRGEIGLAQLDGTDGGGSRAAHSAALGSLRLSDRAAHWLSLGADVARAPFDETAALIYSGIASTTVEGDADVTLRPRLSLGGGGGWTRLTGGSGPNNRIGGSGALRWSMSKALSLAAGVRTFGYDHVAADGYFAPKRYLLAEGSGRIHLGGDLGWALDSELGLGHQRITAFDDSKAGRFAQRCTVAASYRPAPGIEWSVGGSFANVASPTTISSADYRAYSITLKGRLRL